MWQTSVAPGIILSNDASKLTGDLTNKLRWYTKSDAIIRVNNSPSDYSDERNIGTIAKNEQNLFSKMGITLREIGIFQLGMQILDPLNTTDLPIIVL